MPFVRTKLFRCGDVLYLRNQRKKIKKVFNSQIAQRLHVYCVVSTRTLCQVAHYIDTLQIAFTGLSISTENEHEKSGKIRKKLDRKQGKTQRKQELIKGEKTTKFWQYAGC